MATHSSILAWRINPMDRGAWRAMVHGVTKSWTPLKRLTTAHRSPSPPGTPRHPREKTAIYEPASLTSRHSESAGVVILDFPDSRNIKGEEK